MTAGSCITVTSRVTIRHTLTLVPNPDTQNWRDDALCAETDPEAFFPEKGASSKDAKRVCAQCSVREQCLADALSKDESFGVWGGLSARERRRLKNRRPARSHRGPDKESRA